MSTLERKIMVHSYLLARFTKTLGATRALDPCLAPSTPRRLTSKQGRREGGGGSRHSTSSGVDAVVVEEEVSEMAHLHLKVVTTQLALRGARGGGEVDPISGKLTLLTYVTAQPRNTPSPCGGVALSPGGCGRRQRGCGRQRTRFGQRRLG